MGCNTPISRIEAVSEAKASSSKCSRGWNRLGTTAATGSSVSDDPAAVLRAPPLGIKAPKPRPSPPRLFITGNLLRQQTIGNGTTRRRIERRDRLAERRRLGQAHAAGHHLFAHPIPEMFADLLCDLFGELGTPVVHHQNDGADFEVGIEILPHQFDIA